MRRLYRLPVCLCAVIIFGGCNQYGARPEITASLDKPADNASHQRGAAAHFDIPAILDELVGSTSPYCPVVHGPKVAIPPRATLGTPELFTDQGIPGICVLEVSPAEAAAVVQRPPSNNKASGYLP
jgi:hypothetical protein